MRPARRRRYRNALVPGLRASADAEHLAQELAFACGRLIALRRIRRHLLDAREAADLENGTWTALLTVYLSPLQDDGDPFRAIRGALTDWAGGELPDLGGVELGPRSSHDPARGDETLIAYRQWAERADPAGGLRGGRRLDAVPALRARLRAPRPARVTRAARFDLLVTLGRLGLYEMEADSLQLVGDDPVTLAAKRVFGIGDRFNLERRARALSEAAAVPLQALDLALANWAHRSA